MRYIHETVVRDVIDLIHGLKDADVIQGFMNRNNVKSIAADSARMVCVFPVFVSTGCSIKNASMVTKAQERKAVSMMRLVMAANSLCALDAANGVNALRKLHVNLKIDDKINVDDFLDIVDTYIVRESVDFMTESQVRKALQDDMKNINTVMESNISEKSINSYMVSESNYNSAVTVREDARDRDILDKLNVAKSTVDLVHDKQLSNNDVKKSNELVETIMNYTYLVKVGDTLIPNVILVGIKAKMYAIDSMDMINRIIIKNKDGNSFTKLVQATTREISFFKDFIFAIDRAKVDALSQSNRGSSSKMWKILERRALKSRIRRFAGMQNDAMAISTLVVTQEEVEYIKKEQNINIERPEVIRPIMEAYNLMSFVIVDETNEVTKFIYDTGNDVYEHISFRNLEREASDGAYRDILKAVGNGNIKL